MEDLPQEVIFQLDPEVSEVTGGKRSERETCQGVARAGNSMQHACARSVKVCGLEREIRAPSMPREGRHEGTWFRLCVVYVTPRLDL